jgi:hypothetical protein
MLPGSRIRLRGAPWMRFPPRVEGTGAKAVAVEPFVVKSNQVEDPRRDRVERNVRRVRGVFVR